ncbi:MAG: PKD domain-containing protein [Candidatus Eisenbacteria sp.]|nr:PKD domain-containing protein [Candidatus Eisenbacteria bacterium]
MKRESSRLPVLLLAIAFVVLTSLGCSTTSGPSENPDPLAASIDSPATDTTIVEGGTVSFQGSAAGGTAPYTYAWDFDGGATNSTVEDPGDIVFETAGTFTVTIVVTDDADDSDSSTVTIPVTAPVAHFPFNGNAEDESGNENDATVYGATLAPDRFGNDDSAYSFNGSGDYIQTPVDSNALPLSVSVWFKASDVSGERSIVDSDVFGQSGHSLIIGWWTGDGNLDIEYHDAGIDVDYSVAVDTWYHAVVNFSGVIQLYVNGVRIGEDFDYTPGSLNGDLFRLGRHNPFDPQWFSGTIDDVRFYGRILTEEDVQTLYSEGGWTGP